MSAAAPKEKGAMRPYTVGPAPSGNTLRLHLNEFRFSHSAEVLNALRDSAMAAGESVLTNYQSGPDPGLVADLAGYVSAPSSDHILVTAGSDEALRAIIDTSGLRNHDTVIMGVPGYTHFEHYARLKAMRIVTYSIGLETSPDDLKESLLYHREQLEAGCLVYLCSPNNPTGDIWPQSSVESLAQQFPKSLFLIDEAYIEFAYLSEEGLSNDAARAFNGRSNAGCAFVTPNVVVTRTMSKAFGLAALRIGYILGTPATISSIAVAASPKALNPIAAPVARAVLKNLHHYFLTTSLARAETAAVVSALKKAGWWVLGTPGNFYLVYVSEPAKVSAALAARGVQVRNRDDLPGLAGFVRITAGTADDNAAVLKAFATLEPPKELPPQTLHSNKGHIAACKSLMKKTLRVLRASKLEFFATAGTLLGMVRHGGMIPWDDDCDLAYVRSPDGDQALALVEPFRAAGLTLQRNRTKAYWQVGSNAPGETISEVHLDLFSYRAVEDASGSTSYELEDPRFREEDPNSPRADCNTRYSQAELYPLCTDFRYYDEVIPVPAQSKKVLQRALGDDFMTTAKVRRSDGSLAVFPIRDCTPA